MGGQLTNNTNEILRIYGPRKNTDLPGYDNGDYWIRNGKSTITVWGQDWDCDGFYVPADRKLKQLVTGTVVNGPVAVKFPDPLHFTVTQEGAIYFVDRPNMGVFNPDEFCRPSDYPKCINWYIPNWAYPEIEKWCGCINQ